MINSNWVPGVLNYLKENHNRQSFFIITATPQKEIDYIIKKLNIRSYFNDMIGSPKTKKDAINFLLNVHSISNKNAIMIGDSMSDYNAANANQLQFVLRRTNLNKLLQESLRCKMIVNFYNG